MYYFCHIFNKVFFVARHLFVSPTAVFYFPCFPSRQVEIEANLGGNMWPTAFKRPKQKQKTLDTRDTDGRDECRVQRSILSHAVQGNYRNWALRSAIKQKRGAFREITQHLRQYYTFLSAGKFHRKNKIRSNKAKLPAEDKHTPKPGKENNLKTKKMSNYKNTNREIF